MVTNRGPGKLLSEEEADRIFSFTKSEWNAAAPKFIPDGWDVRFAKHDTGLHVIGFDPRNGFGVALQPLYETDTDPPTTVIISHYLPKEQFPTITAKLKRDMKSGAQDALGATYKIADWNSSAWHQSNNVLLLPNHACYVM